MICHSFYISVCYRIRKEGDTADGKIKQACGIVLTSLDDHPANTEEAKTDFLQAKQQKAEKAQFDVFISYSHRNPQQAEEMLETFKQVDTNTKVFYDRSALTTGMGDSSSSCL